MNGKEEYHSKPVSDILRELNAKDEGLTSSQAKKRAEKYGYNEIKKSKKDTPLNIILRQFKSFVTLVLLSAAIISALVGHKIEFIVILIIVCLVVIIGFFEEYKASKDMDALIELTPKKERVKRDGKILEIYSKDVTIGDIIVLKRGDIVGADARIIECSGMKLDESALTGESDPVLKSADEIKGSVPLAKQFNMVFAGTNVTDGNCTAVVVSIGESTEIGKISTLIKGIKEESTPLQKRIDKLGKQLSLMAIGLAIIVFFIGVYRGTSWIEMLIFCLAVIISGIPESLPTVIAITLAAGVKKMAKRNAIVKRLPAVETLGTCTVICTDKTGTLTQNKMVIENIFTSDSEIAVTGKGYDPDGIFLEEDIKIDAKKHKSISKILEIGIFCNNSDIKKVKNNWVVDGEATEGALVTLARKAGVIKWEYHKKFPRKHEHPFDAVRKCMSTVHFYQGKHFVYTKGAPETIIKKSKYYLHDGKMEKMTKTMADKFHKKHKEYASNGLRVLGMAFKEHKGSFEIGNVESGLVFVGLVSIRDPPHATVKDSIAQCKQAGIKVVMITGDNELTAQSIATELGIFSSHDEILTGKQLDNMGDEDLDKVANNVTVYARVTPSHKLRIVERLQHLGHIVAMTGDGVNDAPALKKADIGIAMGRGTEVAKESAEIILKDDNFTTIVNAVEEGRTIYENIRKFIYFLLIGNFSEVLIFLIAIMVGASLPLTALMILFLNLVTGELPAIGLSVEKPSDKIMKQKPRDPKESILSDYMLLKIAQLVPLIVLGTISIYIWHLVVRSSTIKEAQTVAFATIIMFELLHALNAKSWDESLFSKKLFSNWSILAGITLSFLATLAVIYIPFFQNIFGTVALGAKEWAIISLVALSVIFWVEIQKTLIAVEIKEREKTDIYPTRG